MTAPAPAKICTVCGKDVARAKRVKDPQGRYYCQPCYDRKRAASPAAPAPAKAPEPAKEPEPIAIALGDEPAPAAPQPAEPAAPAPGQPVRRHGFKNCPSCGAPVLPDRTICLGCQRDLTKMDTLLALQAKDDSPDAAERWSRRIGIAMKLGLWGTAALVALGVVWSVWYLFFGSHGPFDEYPTTHDALVRSFLAEIAKGTDKSYTKAFMLVSFRVRTTNNPDEIALYKLVFTRFHDDMVKKYGADWVNKVRIDPRKEPGMDMDDLTICLVHIDKDPYVITTQVQIPMEDVIYNLPGSTHSKMAYPENGKNRFGVVGIEGYAVHPKRVIKQEDLAPGGMPPVGN